MLLQLHELAGKCQSKATDGRWEVKMVWHEVRLVHRQAGNALLGQ